MARVRSARAEAEGSLIDLTKAKVEGLAKANGTATSASSNTQMEAVKTASGTATVTVTLPAAEPKGVSPAAAVEIDAAAAGSDYSTEARPKGLKARIPRIVFDWDRFQRLSSEGIACRRTQGTQPLRGRLEMAVEAIGALSADRCRRSWRG